MIKQQAKSCAYCGDDAHRKDFDGKYACSVCFPATEKNHYRSDVGKKRQNYNEGLTRKASSYREVRGFIQSDSVRPKISISFEIDDFNKLRDIAKKKDISFARLVRDIVEKFLLENSRET